MQMSIEAAVRWTEILLAIALIQQSLESLSSIRQLRLIFVSRLVCSVLLVVGVATQWVVLGLVGVSLILLKAFQGPYNGGSDRMGLLILYCLAAFHVLPASPFKELAFGYLALQVVLSYFVSGWVKIVNPDWRNGRALQDVFLFSAYPVSEDLRGFANRPKLLLSASWGVMLLELIFPFLLLSKSALLFGLVCTAFFHLMNACFWGLNRFVWVWIASYPSLIWFQDRFVSG